MVYYGGVFFTGVEKVFRGWPSRDGAGGEPPLASHLFCGETVFKFIARVRLLHPNSC